MPDFKTSSMLSRIRGEEESLTKFEAFLLEIQLAHAEYREVCKNVRTGWEYIVTLLRQFIITQLFLIVTVAIFTNDKLHLAAAPSVAAIALMIFASLFSLFVFFQSSRLFDNSQEFVRRAQAIESIYSVGTRRVFKEIEAMPTFTYMEDRLRKAKLWPQMNTSLNILYILSGVIWFITLLAYTKVITIPFLS